MKDEALSESHASASRDTPSPLSSPSTPKLESSSIEIVSFPNMNSATGNNPASSATNEETTAPVRRKQFTIPDLSTEQGRAFRAAWPGELADHLFRALDAVDFQFRSIDVMQYGYPDDPSPPITLCIGVDRDRVTLTADMTAVAVAKCREVLDSRGFPNVGVDIQERVYWP